MLHTLAVLAATKLLNAGMIASYAVSIVLSIFVFPLTNATMPIMNRQNSC